MNCAHCAAPMTGRKRKYCDKTCASRAWDQRRKTIDRGACTLDDCGKPAWLRGLCRTHYSDAMSPDRHTPRTTTCVVCGAAIARSAGGGRRKYGATCSLDCRYALTWGKRCELPADHCGRWYGASTAIVATECAWCGEPFVSRQITAMICSDRCRNARRHHRRQARVHGAQGDFRWADVVKVWMSLGKACAYCLDPLPLNDMQVEHVTPLSRGGRNDLSNILPSCGACNADKGDRTPTEWDADRLAHALPPRARHITVDDQRFAHLVTLTPLGLPYRLRLAS